MDIRAAEISAILKDQIKSFGKEAEVSEVGQVLSVGDGIARVFGLDVKVDPAIIGGLVVKLGSRMVDSSLRTKLNSIKHAMKEVG